MITVQLLGGAYLRSGDTVLGGPPAQRHRIALLALIVDAWPQPLSRDRALALLWPERDDAGARRLLNLAVHVLRSALGDEAIAHCPERARPDDAAVLDDGHGEARYIARSHQARNVARQSRCVGLSRSGCYRGRTARVKGDEGNEPGADGNQEGTMMNVRAANETEIDHLAKIWHDGWHDAHARILPAELTRLRTLESFRDRLRAVLPKIRVAGPFAAPVGFCILKDNELYQLYVSAQARGSGVAAALIADAEGRLAEDGFETAWLACAVGNDRAARFYDKSGWRRTGTVVYQAEVANGTIPLEVWRYEKDLRAD